MKLRSDNVEETGSSRIDVDIHVLPPGVDTLSARLSSYWRETLEVTGFRGAAVGAWPAVLADRRQHGGGSTVQQPAGVLDELGSSRGIVHCDYAIDTIRNPDAAAAFCAAINDWLLEECLADDARLSASLLVPTFTPAIAAAEIRRVGSDPRDVQVSLPVRSTHPWGRRDYYPLFDAMAEAGLVAGLGYGGQAGNPPTSSGWPSYQVEEHVGMAALAQTQIMSMISEGLFDRYRDLKVAVLDCGVGWLPAYLWRFDKDWKGLRREVPWVSAPPSEYVRERFRFCLAAGDLPWGDQATVDYLMEESGGPGLFMFGSDFPHSTVAEARALRDAVETGPSADRLLGGNAAELYALSS